MARLEIEHVIPVARGGTSDEMNLWLSCPLCNRAKGDRVAATDPETGAVEVVAYASVNDVGRVVNPLIVTGQLDGGAAQGIGQALHERFVYDADSGQALTASFMSEDFSTGTVVWPSLIWARVSHAFIP